MKITKDINIAELIKKYPEVIEILLARGVHCIGCHVAPFETLGQGLTSHGMNNEEINKVIEELNEVVEKAKS